MTRIKIRGRLPFMTFMNDMFNGEFHILLSPGMGNQYLHYKDYLSEFGVNFGITQYLDFYEMDTIATRCYPGSQELFASFKIYSFNFWLILMLLMTFMAIFSTMAKDKINFRHFAQNIWRYILILISVPMNRVSPQFVLSFWLITTLFVSKYFSAYLLDFMVKSVPLVTINTLEELSQKPDIKIVTREDSSLKAFTKLDNSSLARALSTQLENHTYIHFGVERVAEKLAIGLKYGNVSFVYDRIYIMKTLVNLISQGNISLESVYISRQSANYEPNFIMVNLDMPSWAFDRLNKLYVFHHD